MHCDRNKAGCEHQQHTHVHLTVLFVDEGSEGLRICCGQESAHSPGEDVTDNQRPLKGYPFMRLVAFQRRCCKEKQRFASQQRFKHTAEVQHTAEA